MLRISLCLAAALAMFFVTGSWAPPFPYRPGYAPPRDVTSRVNFEVPRAPTPQEEQRARSSLRVVYSNDPRPLIQLRQSLQNAVVQVTAATAFEQLPAELWSDFTPPRGAAGTDAAARERADFERFRAALSDEGRLAAFAKAVELALRPHERDGLLQKVHDREEGDVSLIEVHPLGSPEDRYPVAIDDVLLGKAERNLRERLEAELQSVIPAAEDRGVVVDRVYHWLAARLPVTLSLNKEATELAWQARREGLTKTDFFPKGRVLAEGGIPLTNDARNPRSREFELLRREHEAYVARLTPAQILAHSLAQLGLYVVLFAVCGAYVYYRERRIFDSLRRFLTLLALVVVTVSLAAYVGAAWRAEMIPLLVFSMTVAIAYRAGLALLLTVAVALVTALALGQRLGEFVVLMAAATTAIQLIRPVRSRTKLIYVGLAAAGAAMLATLCAGTLDSQPFVLAILPNSFWVGFCAMVAGVLMTGLLPFVERLFEVQTELSLLELGDAAHPLLQELVRRAPGTYNHSINVASIGEAAAEAIAANGLLVRVGAYFHDIGKMLKPQYFVENQGQELNRHESLLPAMSTLVIIAHVKDGADLARQHGLPQSIIDFIQQHHGTTLVEYFYDRANQRSLEEPDAPRVDESNFRYPGPKPQTKEAGVMMLADAVESASRTLVEPTPARIENLVHRITEKRLLDGQFEESGLTLTELRAVEQSLIKSLTAVYHGRVKYPGQQQEIA